MKRSGTKAKYSPMQQASVYQVQFTTISEDLLTKWSVAEIKQSRLYDGNEPTVGSPNDLRLGVSSQDQKCKTCGETKQCQGHFGHIRLSEPVFHYGFLKYIEKILRCVCHRCYKLKTPTTVSQAQNFEKKLRHIQRIQNKSRRLNEVTKMLQNIKQCKIVQTKNGDQIVRIGCGLPIPTKVTLKNYKFYAADQQNSKVLRPLERHQIKKILEQVSKQKDTCKYLGFEISKPIDLMIQSLAIPPPQIRPSIQMNPQKKAEDDITSAYLKILKLNAELKKQGYIMQKNNAVDELERTIASVMIKLNRAKLQKTGLQKRKIVKSYKSISDRLKGKQGRFRQNLMGKRVDFSARSVISGDSNLALDQLGVPLKIASKLTIPQQITKWNYDRILNLCRQGKVHVILKPPQDRLRDNQKPANIAKLHTDQVQKYINYGMIAQRTLQDGDYVLFNRQPTLHRMSMMGHRVKILPYNTFRLNLSVCTPYNADFDGDEMNMHVPQNFQTISQLKNIAHVPKQIIAPKNNAPVIGMVQDALLGVYLFTMRDTFLTRQQVMNLVIWIEGKQHQGGIQDLLPGQLPIPAILKPEPLWTGKQVMSMIIPKKITIQIKKGSNPYANLTDITMIIKKGELITGALQKEVVGSGAGGLVHSIWLQISPDATNDFISVAQRVVNNWLISNSFTVGACDIAPDDQLVNAINKQYNAIDQLFYETFDKYRNPEIIQKQRMHQKGKKVIDSFEFFINQKLNGKLGTAQEGVKKYVSPYLNNIFKMITAKSKGSQTNLAQIMFLVGNQNVDGKRCPLGFARRALPHFLKDDNSPQPRGFVFSSFYKGLKPHEFFFHSMGGREGLSDTAVKTSRTGYIQRKLVKSLEDLIIRYDGTVRDSKNNFLQKMYGEDGFLSEYIEKHKFQGAELGIQDFEKKYRWPDEQLISTYKYSTQQSIKIAEEYQKLLQIRKRARQVFVLGKDNTSIQYHCPIKMQRLIDKIKSDKTTYEGQTVDPYFVYTEVQKLMSKCIPYPCLRKYKQLELKLEKTTGKNKKIEEKRFNLIRQFEQQTGLQIFRMHIRHNLASKKMCKKDKISKIKFVRLLQQIEYKFHQSLAPAGQSIGAIAAQSIGEPTTQMTLNTFHLAGVSDKNVTLGVPRLQQLLDVSKNIKTPNMTIFFKDIINQRNLKQMGGKNRQFQVVTLTLPERHLNDYIQSSRLYYDYSYTESRIGIASTQQSSESKRLPFVINFQFNQKKVAFMALWDYILEKLRGSLKGVFQVIQHKQFNVYDESFNNQDAQKAQRRRKQFLQNQKKSYNPQIVLRLLERGGIDYQKKFEKKQSQTNYNFLTRMQYEIRNLYMGGIPGIKTVKSSRKFIMNAPDDKKINLDEKQKQQYVYCVFETDGSNLKTILTLSEIDATKTYCNDMTQIYSVLGIEAARQSFINQFKQIIKPYGIYVNYRHLSILIDWMTMRGFITPVNRNGINRVKDVSVLRKASYQQTADILFGAAVFSERDYLKGVSEKVIFGQPVQMGTSSFKIMVDSSQVADYKAKGGNDKNQAIAQFNSGDKSYRDFGSQNINPLFGGGNTPYMFTPVHQYGGQSVLQSMRSPAIGNAAFTPAHEGPSFTPAHYESGSSMSPGIMGNRTPIYSNLGSQTPVNRTPAYTLGNFGASSPRTGGASVSRYGDIRSSVYHGMTSSPGYDRIRSSQSPSYSPVSSNYGSSPNYSPRDSNRQQNDSIKQNQQDQEDHDHDEF